jgi:hypothetical protein
MLLAQSISCPTITRVYRGDKERFEMVSRSFFFENQKVIMPIGSPSTGSTSLAKLDGFLPNPSTLREKTQKERLKNKLKRPNLTLSNAFFFPDFAEFLRLVDGIDGNSGRGHDNALTSHVSFVRHVCELNGFFDYDNRHGVRDTHFRSGRVEQYVYGFALSANSESNTFPLCAFSHIQKDLFLIYIGHPLVFPELPLVGSSLDHKGILTRRWADQSLIAVLELYRSSTLSMW